MRSMLNRWMVVALVALACAFAVPGLAFADEPADTGGNLVAGDIADEGGNDSADSGTDPVVTPAKAPALKYRTQLAGKGWSSAVAAGKTSGKEGKGKSVQRFKTTKVSGLSYRVSVAGKWQAWKNSSATAGKKGKAINALSMKLSGSLANTWDVEYRVYVAKVGWQPWTVNGGVAGKVKKATEIEAVQVRFVQKDLARPLANGVYYIAPTKAAATVLKSAAQAKKVSFKSTDLARRFKVQNEGEGISIQSVATGKYLCEVGGKVVERPYSSRTNYTWKLSWNGGYKVVNTATGNALALSGSKAVANAKGRTWTFTATDMIPSGTFIIKNALSGMLLDVEDVVTEDGSNIQVYKARKGNGSQVFTFKPMGTDVYRITNYAGGMAVRASGTDVDQGEPSKKKAQQWRATLDNQGRITFTNLASGKVLAAEGKAKSGYDVGVEADAGKASQRWTLKPKKFNYINVSGNATLDKALAKINKSYGSLYSAFRYVVGFGYRSGARYWSGPSTLSNATTINMAKDMVSHHSGNCYRFASLFCWIAKSKGYEARVRSGWVAAAGGGQAPHGWAEVNVNGAWRICDPDLAHEMPGHKWYMVSYAGAPTAYHFW